MSKIALDLTDHHIILSQGNMTGGPYWIEARPKYDNGLLYYIFGPFPTYQESKDTSKNFNIGVNLINDAGVTRFTYLEPFKRFTSKEWNGNSDSI